MNLQNLSPAMGAILRAWWPHEETPKLAGPKLRPVIFLGETKKDGRTFWVVAYGTTQIQEWKETRNGGDMIVHLQDEGNVVLNSDTRFDFNKLQEIPATSEFFKVNKIGELPAHQLQQTAECMRNANVAKRLSRMGCNF